MSYLDYFYLWFAHYIICLNKDKNNFTFIKYFLCEIFPYLFIDASS